MNDPNPYAAPQPSAAADFSPMLSGFRKLGVVASLALALIITSNLVGEAGVLAFWFFGSDVMWWFEHQLFVILPLAIAGILMFLIWIHRATSNARLFNGADLGYSPRLAVGGFFIPFANLVIPCSVMIEVFEKSFLAAGGKSPKWLVLAWWFSYLASNLLIKIAGKWEELGLVSFGLRLAAMAFLVGLVATLTAVQHRVAGSPQLLENLPLVPRRPGIYPWQKRAAATPARDDPERF